LSFLQSLSLDNKNGRIFGKISRSIDYKEKDKPGPFANLPIKIQQVGNDEKVFYVITDNEGKYEISVPVGKYKIMPALPNYAQLDRYSRDMFEVVVKPGSCVGANSTIENKGQISGKVVSADGEPVEDVTVELVSTDLKEWVKGDETKPDGSFSLTDIPIGKYVLAINHFLTPHAKSPFPPFFYPKTSVGSDAKIIEIDVGMSIDDLVFQLPQKLKEKEVRGKVVSTNGKPLAGVRIELEDLGRDNDHWSRDERNATTDSKGNFVVRGFEGRKYQIKAEYKKIERLDEGNLDKILKTDDREMAPAMFYDAEKNTQPFIIGSNPLNFRIVLKIKVTPGSVQL
jgi:hypothetical protein